MEARASARTQWYASPVHSYCARVGIASWEGLWCRFQGEEPELGWLRDWSAHYRQEAWRLALGAQGIDDEPLATELGERFAVERRARSELFEDTRRTLEALHGTHRLGLLTNGARCLQREKLTAKLTASGLEPFFDAVVVSGEVGVGKPEGAVFAHALALLGVGAADAVMVGDSLERDIDGALETGLRAVWVNRTGAEHPGERFRLSVIETLDELPAALARI